MDDPHSKQFIVQNPICHRKGHLKPVIFLENGISSGNDALNKEWINTTDDQRMIVCINLAQKSFLKVIANQR